MKEAVDRDYVDAMITAAPVPHLAALQSCSYTLTGARPVRHCRGAGVSDANVDLQAATATFRPGRRRRFLMSFHLTAQLVAMLANLPRTGNNARKVFGYASRHSVYGVLKKMAKDAGYKYVPPHQVGRHSFATALLDAGYTVADVMKLGNWKSAKMVLEIYAHSKKGRAEAIEDVFGKKPIGTVTPIGTISAQELLKSFRNKDF